MCWYFGCENPIATKDERKHKTKCAGYGLLGTVDLIISSIVYVSVFNSNGFHSFKSHAHPFRLWQVNGEFVSSIAALLNQLAIRWRNQRPRTKSNIKSFYKCKTYNLHPGELKPQREKKHTSLNRKQTIAAAAAADEKQNAEREWALQRVSAFIITLDRITMTVYSLQYSCAFMLIINICLLHQNQSHGLSCLTYQKNLNWMKNK